MREYTVLSAVVLAHTLSAAVIYGSESGGPIHNEEIGVTITLTELKVAEKTIEIRYKIMNSSDHDIWLCDEINVQSGFEHYLGDDRETLRVRRQLGVPFRGVNREQPFGQYVRLRPHECRTESVLLRLPVHSGAIFNVGALDRVIGGSLTVKRLTLEIGFYNGNLPETVLDLTKGLRELVPGVHRAYPSNAAEWFGGLRAFFERNEPLRDREERVVIPWTNQAFEGEQVVQMVVDGLSVPWVGGPATVAPSHDGGLPVGGPVLAPRFERCTRAEIRYAPSMLEYFFPYPSQQALLSSSEKKYLQSQKTIVVEDEASLTAFMDEVEKGFQCEIVTEDRTADVVCYCDDERLASLTVYDNRRIETEDKHWFRYLDGLQSMRHLAKQIQPYELRLQCADNFRNLWYRLRFYRNMMNTGSTDSSAAGKAPYPDAAEWSAVTESAFHYSNPDYSNLAVYRCPDAGEGKCHYAMNPRCRVDSPGDTVLLFETKAGWNQHGGPELFALDNHDPKGGCVLLNDGTVKFIRTQEELQQLRWKP